MNVLITLLVLGLIIFLHELGHFATAKYYGMPVSEFSVGMGPIVYQKEYKDTKYSLRILPLGGYVLIEGMMPIDKNDKSYSHLTEEEIIEYNKKGFCSYSKIKRIVVLLAGIFMNFATAIIAYLIFFLIQNKGISSINLAFKNFISIFYLTIEGIKMLITGAVSASNMVGPIGLPKIFASQIVSHGYIVLFPLYSLLSINIGLLNLLPIPALDGGRVVFVLLEYLGIKLNKKIEEFIHTIGFILLLLLMVYVFYNDILRIFVK